MPELTRAQPALYWKLHTRGGPNYSLLATCQDLGLEFTIFPGDREFRLLMSEVGYPIVRQGTFASLEEAKQKAAVLLWNFDKRHRSPVQYTIPADLKITKCSPGVATGAHDLQRWANNVKDQKYGEPRKPGERLRYIFCNKCKGVTRVWVANKRIKVPDDFRCSCGSKSARIAKHKERKANATP